MLIVSNIEKINDSFKLPISYNEGKVKLNKNIITDLELTETLDPSCTPMYNIAFQPKTNLGLKVLQQMTNYYTNDKQFLKDTQTLLKEYKPLPLSQNICLPDFNEILNIWDEIKNDTGFKEKYHYIDWPMWEFLNKSGVFLQIMSIYNLISPVLSFFVPFIILIIPFFIIKMKGQDISITEYVEVLTIVASNHAIGKLFTQFNSVKLDEKIYLLLSAGFYVFSIYQNILTCYRFHKNMHKIHNYLEVIKKYIEYTESSMKNMLMYTDNLKTYQLFNNTIRDKLQILTTFKSILEKISPYKLSPHKIGELGHVLHCFYDIYSNDVYNDAFLYSFGFNGYIDTIEGLKENISEKYINYSKISNQKKEKNKNKDKDMEKDDDKNDDKEKCGFKNAYYPALIHEKPIKNSFKFDKNMIVTGPNASGKTTILKSALINVILTQQFGCGFYDSAVLVPFKYIHCYLNIPDTSGRDSLFQAESRKCKEMIKLINKHPTDRHFCVFDELYSGTNYEEATKCGYAFLLYLSKYKTTNFLLTTHYLNVCEKLDNHKNIQNYKMCVGKNENYGLIYKYKIERGITNIKGGIEVLKQMKYPDEIMQTIKNLD